MSPTLAVTVACGSAEYRVEIGAGLLARAGELVRAALSGPSRRATIVCDDKLPGETVESCEDSLRAAGFETSRLAITASETLKTLESVERILAHLAGARHERSDPLLALGGGVVGDVAGFAGAIYRRGVPVVQCPTTLLAMVDASVGGKTGVNLRAGGAPLKNAVGSFHQPVLVIADVTVLGSLPARELKSGLAECIKHACIARTDLAGAAPMQTDLDAHLEQSLPAVLALDPATLSNLVAWNVRTKARFVWFDEREVADDDAGGRALLNLGHTYAHAMETLASARPGNGLPPPLLHGEAVAAGIVAAAHAAAALGRVSARYTERTESLVGSAGLPSRVSGLPSDDWLIGQMAHDKKNLGGVFRLVLPFEPAAGVLGHAGVVANPPREAIVAGWAAIRA